jgi:hypothetical protein
MSILQVCICMHGFVKANLAHIVGELPFNHEHRSVKKESQS